MVLGYNGPADPFLVTGLNPSNGPADHKLEIDCEGLRPPPRPSLLRVQMCVCVCVCVHYIYIYIAIYIHILHIIYI